MVGAPPWHDPSECLLPLTVCRHLRKRTHVLLLLPERVEALERVLGTQGGESVRERDGEDD